MWRWNSKKKRPDLRGTACPCHRLGWRGPLHLSQPCCLLSWVLQIQPIWDSPRAWPLSLSPSVLTPSPTSCTVPCWGHTPFNSPCPPAPVTLRRAAPNQAPPGGHLQAAGAGTSHAGHARASGGGGLGGPSSQRKAGQGTLRLAPGPHSRRRRHHPHCPHRTGRRKCEAQSHQLPPRTGTLNTRTVRAQPRVQRGPLGVARRVFLEPRVISASSETPQGVSCSQPSYPKPTALGGRTEHEPVNLA